MNQTAAFQAGLRMLGEIREAAAQDDEYAKQLLAMYEAHNMAVVWMPWPKPKEKK